LNQINQKIRLTHFPKDRFIHFVGIGGIGMSAIAQILLNRGYLVSGSDQKDSLNTIRLRDQGARIFIGHKAENVREADCIVVSSAIAKDNPELTGAKENNIAIYPRAQMLSILMDESKHRIAIAGTHGKTTTSAMTSMVLEQAGVSPTFLVGGVLNEKGSNAGLGGTEYFVAEADESDSSILLLNPNILVITNIEADHLDHFENLEAIMKVFETCVANLPQDGLLVVNAEHHGTKELLKRCADKKILPNHVVTFGFEAGKFQAKNLRSEGLATKFSLVDSETKTLQEIELSIPGEHNVLNAMAVIAVMKHLGIHFSPMLSGLKRFTGTKRRFQIIGETGGVLIVDDYAHHPSEITATLHAARQGFNPEKLWAIFQPHRYTRTYFFEQGFAESLQIADEVIVTDVYAASESPIEGVSGENITRRITSKPVHYFPKKDEIGLYLSKLVQPGEMVVFMGAGDIYAVAKDLHHRLVQKSFPQIQSLDQRALGQDADVSNKIA